MHDVLLIIIVQREIKFCGRWDFNIYRPFNLSYELILIISDDLLQFRIITLDDLLKGNLKPIYSTVLVLD